jgi:hypothetical protein
MSSCTSRGQGRFGESLEEGEGALAVPLGRALAEESDGSVAGEDERGRDGIGGKQRRWLAFVEVNRQAEPAIRENLADAVGWIGGEAENLDAHVGGQRAQARDARQLGDTRHAPGRPEVEERDLAAQAIEG